MFGKVVYAEREKVFSWRALKPGWLFSKRVGCQHVQNAVYVCVRSQTHTHTHNLSLSLSLSLNEWVGREFKSVFRVCLENLDTPNGSVFSWRALKPGWLFSKRVGCQHVQAPLPPHPATDGFHVLSCWATGVVGVQRRATDFGDRAKRVWKLLSHWRRSNTFSQTLAHTLEGKTKQQR